MSITVEEIKELELAYEFAQAKLQSAKNEYAASICPFAVGDVVKCCGYAHEGKDMQINRIWLSQRHNGDYIWECSGVILKNNGEPSKYRAKFTQPQWESAK